MAESNRVRRTALLCLYCVGNVACYRAGWTGNLDARTLRVRRDFWVRANGNFFDIAVLEWCKLFSEKTGKHHWSRVLDDKAGFRESLFAAVHLTASQFTIELKEIKRYRDKYIAHLDDPTVGNYPKTEFMLRSASHLYETLVAKAETNRYLAGAPWAVGAFYESRYADASSEVRAASIAGIHV